MFGFGRKKKAIDELAFCVAEKLLPFTETAHNFGVFWTRLESSPYLVGFINGRIKSQLAGCRALVESQFSTNLSPNDLMEAANSAIAQITRDAQRFVWLTEQSKNAPDYDRAYDDAAQIMRWYAGVDDITQHVDYAGLLALAESMQSHIEQSGMPRRKGTQQILACWAAEAQLFGLKFENEDLVKQTTNSHPPKTVRPPQSHYIISDQSDISRFASFISRELSTLPAPDLTTLFVARSAIDLHQELKDEIVEVSAEESYADLITRLERKIQEAGNDLVVASKARWLLMAHALKRYERLVADNAIDAEDLIRLYARMASQVANGGLGELGNRIGIFSTDEVKRATSVFMYLNNSGDSSEVFCNILNSFIPHSAYDHDIWSGVAARNGVVATCELESYPARDLDTVVCTQELAEEWNQAGS